MRKLNKQDFIFIGGTLLFIVVTFIAYLFITQYFILDNCHPIRIYGGLPGGGGFGYTCFGYYNFFNKSSIYFYLLFLGITIIPFVRRKYLFPSKTVFILGIVVIILVLLYIFETTSIIYLENFKEGPFQIPIYNQ